jgi:hypothetical protein
MKFQQRSIVRGAGTIVSVAFAVYLSSNPHWATDNPRLSVALYYVAIGAGVYLFLSFVLQWKWVRWFFGIKPSLAVSDLPLSDEAKPKESRLKIISAHWGIEGISNPNVTPRLVRRQTGDCFVAPVELDLFDGFDPVSGKNKILTVRYSFDGTEATVAKKEHELLVLPDPSSSISESRIMVTALREDDPRLEVEFRDDRQYQPRTASLVLTNRGSREALRIQIRPIQLRERVIEFPSFQDRLAASASARFVPEVGDQWGFDSHHDFIRALSEQWAKTTDDKDKGHLRECVIPVSALYEDAEGVLFEVAFEIVYHAGHANFNPDRRLIAECRNAQYRRIPKGITL